MDWRDKRATASGVGAQGLGVGGITVRTPTPDLRPLRGLGLGTTVHVSGKRHFGDYDGGSAAIKVSEDGKVFIWCGEGEIGQGATTVLCQIAAEELGVPFADVAISQADTDFTTYCHGAYASRLTYVAGNAVKDAAANVKAELLAAAAELLEVAPGDLEIRAGRVFVRGVPSGQSLTVAQVARGQFRQGGKPIIGTGSFDPDSVLQDENRYGNESGAYNFGAQMAEVEVDPRDRSGHHPELRVRGGLRHRGESDCGAGSAAGRDRPGDRLCAHRADAHRGRPALKPEFRRLPAALHDGHATTSDRVRGVLRADRPLRRQGPGGAGSRPHGRRHRKRDPRRLRRPHHPPPHHGREDSRGAHSARGGTSSVEITGQNAQGRPGSMSRPGWQAYATRLLRIWADEIIQRRAE